MKVIHVGDNNWVFEDEVKQQALKQLRKKHAADDKEIEVFIKSQVALGRGVEDVMAEVMSKLQARMQADFADLDDMPITPFEVIQNVWRDEGFDAAILAAESYILSHEEDPDGYFNLAYLYEIAEEHFSTLLASREAVRLYLQLFPKKFDWQKSQLPWGFFENRPFLRALFQLAQAYAKNGEYQKACHHAETLLKICPDDNIGIREWLVEWYMNTQDYKRILQVCADYPEDVLANVVFGSVIAYCYQNKLEDAKAAWVEARDCLPKVAHEILKKRHSRPRGYDDNAYGMEIGGANQAYSYWQDMGQWWEQNDTAQALIELMRAEKAAKK